MQSFETVVLRQNTTYTFGNGAPSGLISNYITLDSEAMLDAEHAIVITGRQTLHESSASSC